MLAQQLGAAAHVLEPAADRSAVRGRPTLQKYSERAPQVQVVFTREADKFEGVRRGAHAVATHQFEQGRVHFPVRVRANMRDVRDPQMGAVNERDRARSVAQRPQSYREIEHRGDPGSGPKRKARSSSRPGWNKASARSK